ncbi:NADPH-dependent oxidoreductase [Vagococcus elongatus]|uniref:NADPH-dependent oxidoreductase n=1 Tax=Vagococcus elongatus TaxID=180344 RepID=A0A430AX55_9ENTE|nr:NADPH-dependent oxidoreductase [Vagococcus elongatus]RSU12657.1 NADPH-dependent oxidoreductase [Vagococcus elongatus]
MNETIKTQLDHRTIRKFLNEEVSQDDFNTLIEVAQRTATSNFMQSYSIIQVTDQSLKDEIAKICNQTYVAEAPCLLIFVADQHRNHQIAAEENQNTDVLAQFDRFMVAMTDACLAAQNVVVAAESLGYGTVYLGSIGNDSQKMVELLNLPDYVFPVLGLGIGKPAEAPSQKPRLPKEVVLHTNSYETTENIHEALADYDALVETYYDSRDTNNRLDSFTKQIVTGMSRQLAKRKDLLENAKKQGFILK